MLQSLKRWLFEPAKETKLSRPEMVWSADLGPEDFFRVTHEPAFWLYLVDDENYQNMLVGKNWSAERKEPAATLGKHLLKVPRPGKWHVLVYLRTTSIMCEVAVTQPPTPSP